MENLWPKNILFEQSTLSEAEQVRELLADQVAGVEWATAGKVQAAIRERNMSIGSSRSLFLFPANQPAKAYEFAAIRSAGPDFPLAIEVFHLKGSRVFLAKDQIGLRKAFRTIFGAAETKSIVKSLAEEAVKLGTAVAIPVQLKGTMSAVYQGDSPSARPIEIGGLIEDGAEIYAMANFFGMLGALTYDDLKKIASKKNISPIFQPLNDKYILELEFLGAVKITLSVQELKVLQAEAQKAIGASGGSTP